MSVKWVDEPSQANGSCDDARQQGENKKGDSWEHLSFAGNIHHPVTRPTTSPVPTLTATVFVNGFHGCTAVAYFLVIQSNGSPSEGPMS